MVVRADRSQFPDDVELEVGQQFEVGTADGERILVTVTEVEGDDVTLDANHPLAGEDLTFRIELVEIR
jgi:peptidylprolyl isomerase